MVCAIRSSRCAVFLLLLITPNPCVAMSDVRKERSVSTLRTLHCDRTQMIDLLLGPLVSFPIVYLRCRVVRLDMHRLAITCATALLGGAALATVLHGLLQRTTHTRGGAGSSIDTRARPCASSTKAESTTLPVDFSPVTSASRFRVVLALKEVTADRYIHFLLRPAVALGAQEVLWIGVQRAKEAVRGTTEYGRAMTREASVPLANFASRFQAHRHLTGGSSGRVRWVGVVHRRSDAPARAVSVETLSAALHDESLRSTPTTLAVLFAGPEGRLTEAEAQEVDDVIFLIDDGGSITDRDVARLNITCAVAIGLHALGIQLGFDARPVIHEMTNEKFATQQKDRRGRDGVDALAQAAVAKTKAARRDAQALAMDEPDLAWL
jgi:hypothetical protein